jgi:tetratricopeptide (TPR) repeat protein
MNSSKRNLILVLVIVLAGLSAAAFFYFNRADRNLNESPFFVMLDKDIITSAESKFSLEMKETFRQKIEEANKEIRPDAAKDALITAYGNRALYQTYLGEYENAYNSYLKSLELNSQSRVQWLALGDLLVKMKAYKTAENAYGKAKIINAYEPQVYLKLADLYKISALDDKEKIKKLFEEGLANIADNTLLLDAYARWSADAGDKTKAIELYQQLIKLQPGNAEALNREIDKLK